MAIVLRSVSDRAGRICVVEEFIGNTQMLDDGFCEDVWAVSYRGETHSPRGNRWGARDRDLLPIRPGDLDETEETSKELEVAK